MNQLQERLSEEVRKYKHLYDYSSSDYKDSQMAMNSWKEIGASIGMDWVECTKEWRKIRDKFVRMKRTLKRKRGVAGGSQNKPTFYVTLSWLEVFIKHRETEANYPETDGDCTPSLPSQTWGRSRGRGARGRRATRAGRGTARARSAASRVELEERVEECHRERMAATQTLMEDSVIGRPPSPGLTGYPPPPPLASTPIRPPVASPPPTPTPWDRKTETPPPAVTPYQQQVLQALNTDMDEHEHFMLSFVPILRRLEPRKQAMARLRMQSLFFELEFGE